MFLKKEKYTDKTVRAKKEEQTYGVIGLGRFGMPLAIKLAESGKDCIVIDNCEEKLRAIRPYTDYTFLVKEPDREALEETGIQYCDTVAVCIGERVDASILVTMNLIQLGVPRVISKATSREQGLVLETLGAEVVFPEHDMALRVARRILTSSVIDHLSLKDNIEISKIEVTERMNGQTIRSLYLRQRYKLNIIAIESEGGTETEIEPDYVLQQGDVLTVIGKSEQISAFEGDSV